MDLRPIIRNRIYTDDEYTFSLGNFRLPKYMYLPGSSKPHDLFLRRHDAYNTCDSPTSKGFRDDLKVWHPGKYIREFPVPIENKNLWEDLIKKFNVEETKRSTNYFLIDYVFPKKGLCVEIDGSQYHTTPNYDKARDEYIFFMLGWKTYRFKNYSQEHGIDFKRFSEIYKSGKDINSSGDLFTSTAIDFFEKKIGLDILKGLSVILDEVPSNLYLEPIYFSKNRFNFLIGKNNWIKRSDIQVAFHYLFRNKLEIA